MNIILWYNICIDFNLFILNVNGKTCNRCMQSIHIRQCSMPVQYYRKMCFALLPATLSDRTQLHKMSVTSWYKKYISTDFRHFSPECHRKTCTTDLCSRHALDNVICPSVLQKDVLCTCAMDNIDHNPAPQEQCHIMV
jgi:hypothetical protein